MYYCVVIIKIFGNFGTFGSRKMQNVKTHAVRSNTKFLLIYFTQVNACFIIFQHILFITIYNHIITIREYLTYKKEFFL